MQRDFVSGLCEHDKARTCVDGDVEVVWPRYYLTYEVSHR